MHNKASQIQKNTTNSKTIISFCLLKTKNCKDSPNKYLNKNHFQVLNKSRVPFPIVRLEKETLFQFLMRLSKYSLRLSHGNCTTSASS